jgi:hypothetical protein
MTALFEDVDRAFRINRDGVDRPSALLLRERNAMLAIASDRGQCLI